MSQALPLCVVAVSLLITYYIFNVRRSKPARMHDIGCKEPPKYPHKDLILGIDLFLDSTIALRNKRLLNNLKERFDRYGQTFQATWMGRVVFYTCDPKNFQAIHALNPEDYRVKQLRPISILPSFQKGVFGTDGLFWEHTRPLTRPRFSAYDVVDLSVLEVHFQKFLKLIPTDGSAVDLKPLLYKLFSDTSTDFLFGESLNTLSPGTPFASSHFLEAFYYAQRGMGLQTLLGRLRLLRHDRQWQQSLETTRTLVDKHVEMALEYRKAHFDGRERPRSKRLYNEADKLLERHTFLYEMAKQTDNRDELRSQIFQVFLAEHDSTATVVGNAVFNLCRDEKKWEKLREEALSPGDKPLTYQTLNNMRYLQYIIKETLRLYPIAPINTHVACRKTLLPSGGGPDGQSPILVGAGQTVITSAHSLHRRPEYWGSDVGAFRPERWETFSTGWHYQPFGNGLRTWYGPNVTITEAAYMLARMAQKWKLRLQG